MLTLELGESDPDGDSDTGFLSFEIGCGFQNKLDPVWIPPLLVTTVVKRETPAFAEVSLNRGDWI